jgi:hypothetical protein
MTQQHSSGRSPEHREHALDAFFASKPGRTGRGLFAVVTLLPAPIVSGRETVA